MPTLSDDNNFLRKSTLLNIFGTALKVAGPILTIVLARVFGTKEFGLFVSTQLLVLTLSHGATLGLDSGLHWFLPQNKLHGRPSHSGIAESFWVSVLAALLLTAGAFFASFTSFASDDLLWYAISLVPYTASFMFGNASQGNRRPHYSIFIDSFIVAVLAPVISIALHYFNIPHALPIGLFFAISVGCLLHFITIKRQFVNMPWWPPKKVPRSLMLYSLPIAFANIVENFLSRTGLWLVLMLLGSGDAGAYALMITISNGLQTIRYGFYPILLPIVAGMDAERHRLDLKPVFSYCVSMVTLIQLIIGFFIVLFPKEILMIAGKDFVIQPEALGILLFMHLLSGFFGMSESVLKGLGKSSYMLSRNIVCLAAAFVSGYLLIPKFGLVGAAFSTLIYNLVFLVWNNVYLVKLNLWPYSAKLCVQCIWILLLTALYVAINSGVLVLDLWEKIGIYIVLLAILVISLIFQKKKFA
ncbi:hypothetical protein AGMMS49938_06010 [Fibrobacterales bacterium]|nr:hypothetical protein AGMMS49938_06010 [Fibrobacterales bacterium]